jgi:hypothetical protein
MGCCSLYYLIDCMEPTEPYLPQDKVFTADKRQYGKLELKARARGMRHEPTPAEEKLWQQLRVVSTVLTATSRTSCAFLIS